MFDTLTAAAARALSIAGQTACAQGAAQVEPIHLLSALVTDRESSAAALLRSLNARVEWLDERLSQGHGSHAAETQSVPPPLSSVLRGTVLLAIEHARRVDRGRHAGTEHLLLALGETPGETAALLDEAGAPVDALHRAMGVDDARASAPLPPDVEMAPLELSVPGEAIDLARIVDAAANRAREGLRVVEDYVRFVLDDPMLTRRLKECRHKLAAATRALDANDDAIAARDTPGDVGTHIMTTSEQVRENPRAVLVANLRRTAEALRSLEEYSKLIDVWLAGRFEVLRYDVYILEKLVLTAVAARARLDDARLYVLVGNCSTLNELIWIVEESLAGGAQVIQLREKGLSEREFLRHAREVRILTAKARAGFIVNDRADFARLSGADGVHLGQDDVSVRDARRIVGSASLVGVSTHNPAQLERAALDGASYLGVGPVFDSETKEFERFAGLAFVREASATTTRPWFAIGGITTENINEVIDAGARRVAVSAAITRSGRPRATAKALRNALDAVEGD